MYLYLIVGKDEAQLIKCYMYMYLPFTSQFPWKISLTTVLSQINFLSPDRLQLIDTTLLKCYIKVRTSTYTHVYSICCMREMSAITLPLFGCGLTPPHPFVLTPPPLFLCPDPTPSPC